MLLTMVTSSDGDTSNGWNSEDDVINPEVNLERRPSSFTGWVGINGHHPNPRVILFCV